MCGGRGGEEEESDRVARWARTFETKFVESDQQSLHMSTVPVGEKVYLQRYLSHQQAYMGGACGKS